MESFRKGLPLLLAEARKDGPADVALLNRLTERALRLVPAKTESAAVSGQPPV
jgi:hypothetical protein